MPFFLRSESQFESVLVFLRGLLVFHAACLLALLSGTRWYPLKGNLPTADGSFLQALLQPQYGSSLQQICVLCRTVFRRYPVPVCLASSQGFVFPGSMQCIPCAKNQSDGLWHGDFLCSAISSPKSPHPGLGNLNGDVGISSVDVVSLLLRGELIFPKLWLSRWLLTFGHYNSMACVPLQNFSQIKLGFQV